MRIDVLAPAVWTSLDKLNEISLEEVRLRDGKQLVYFRAGSGVP